MKTNETLSETPQHTAGPWRHVQPTYGPLHVIVSAKDEHIAEVFTRKSNPQWPATANARLIAAAPEMYEALCLIARSEGFKDGTWPGELQAIARKVLAKLR